VACGDDSAWCQQCKFFSRVGGMAGGGRGGLDVSVSFKDALPTSSHTHTHAYMVDPVLLCMRST
jgi:hypothetical protein